MPIPQYKHVFRNIQALRGGKPETGDLYLQDFHLIFCFPPQSQLDENSKPAPKETKGWFAYQVISQCSLRPCAPSSGIPPAIRIRFRDFTFVSFNFNENSEARAAFEFIRARTCRLGSIDKLLAFNYHPRPDSPEVKADGWNFYDARAEFRRQGISEKSADLGWRISSLNKDHQFSPTYPALLVVPSKISDTTLKHAGSYRSRSRIPTLTYLHPVNNCTITRSSQPFTGLRFKRSIQDERLVGACFSPASSGSHDTSASTSADQTPVASEFNLSTEGAGGDADLSSMELETEKEIDEELLVGNALYDEKTGKRLIYGAQQHNLIVDARPAINSYAMQAVGLGSENMDHYKFARKVFLNIDNIHVMRASLEKVIEAIKDADVSPFPPNQDLLAKSKWLTHIQFILDGSGIIARQVGIQHSNVLIHCSDGWDRTSQLSALSQLMLDPYYRTIDGFIVLVEKDWLSFGHMFQLRSGHLSHESWFTVDNDSLAGTTINPNEADPTPENAIVSGAKRFYNRFNGSKEEGSDADPSDEAKSAPAKEQDQATSLKNVSPVFHQFLDATYQLLRQHPTQFEFNERFLRRLFYHVYSCQYGTFLCNSEFQREKANLKERTQSVWGYFLSRKAEFTNDQYDPVIDDHVKGRERLIFPRLSEVRWWHQLFNRTDEEMNGALNASAAAAERVAAYSSGMVTPIGVGDGASPQQSGSVSPARSPQPPSLSSSQSVPTAGESAHAALTPGARSPPSFNRSASTPTDSPGALAKLQDRIAGLAIGKGVFGGPAEGTGRTRTGGAEGSGDRELEEVGDQELKSMD